MVTGIRIIKVRPLPDIDLTHILSIEHRASGLSLVEDDHSATLFQRGTPVAHFSLHATCVEIYKEADKYLDHDAGASALESGGISFGVAR